MNNNQEKMVVENCPHPYLILELEEKTPWDCLRELFHYFNDPNFKSIKTSWFNETNTKFVIVFDEEVIKEENSHFNFVFSTNCYSFKDHIIGISGDLKGIKVNIKFYKLKSLKYIKINNMVLISGLRTFYGCESLVDIDSFSLASDEDGGCNCTAFMFAKCYSLRSIPEIDTSNVRDMESMFANCSSLQLVPPLDTSNVKDMRNMFKRCESLVNVPYLDTSSVKTFRSMFSECFNLRKVPKFNTKSAINVVNMFSFCKSLEEVPQFDLSNVTYTTGMFSYCYALMSIPNLNTSKAKFMSFMFYKCRALEEVKGLSTNDATDLNNMFDGCINLKRIPELDFSKAKIMDWMFADCKSLESRPIISADMPNCRSSEYMFHGCNNK